MYIQYLFMLFNYVWFSIVATISAPFAAMFVNPVAWPKTIRASGTGWIVAYFWMRLAYVKIALVRREFIDSFRTTILGAPWTCIVSRQIGDGGVLVSKKATGSCFQVWNFDPDMESHAMEPASEFEKEIYFQYRSVRPWGSGKYAWEIHLGWDLPGYDGNGPFVFKIWPFHKIGA